jgi:bacteriocin biosynthesis cyclodehydratase domain-containing protein
MVLTIDPRFPLVWRSPTSLQFGVAAPVVVLAEVTPADERMIAALTLGVTTPGLEMIARAAGADDTAVDTLLGQLRPALARPADTPARTVAVAGGGPTATRIAELLRASGVAVTVTDGQDAAAQLPCDLAIAVGHFVLAPELHGVWLRRDIPHLSVVFTDTTVEFGPIVEPGTGPCLYCLQRYRTDADPSWPAISAQLWGRLATTERPLATSEVAAMVSRAALRRLGAGHAASDHLSTTITVESGEVTTRAWTPHPQCGCQNEEGFSAAVPRGSGSPGADPDGTIPRSSSRWPPTTDSACAVPA